jgi:hypothetical protein
MLGMAATLSAAQNHAPVQTRPALILMVAKFSDPSKNLAATTLAWMAREKGVEFDASYAADREGGIFSNHGSTALGGRHASTIARALAEFDTTVVRLDDAQIFESLLRAPAALVTAWSGSPAAP